MFLFRQNKKNNEKTVNPLQDKLVNGIAGSILKAQKYFASFLDRKVNCLSNRDRKIGFVIFCVFTACLSFYYIATAITGTDKNAMIIQSGKIKTPKYYDQTGETKTELLISQNDYQSVELFEKYMDSVQQNKTGKAMYDSILHARPGLMDSVKMLEYIFQQQNQKK